MCGYTVEQISFLSAGRISTIRGVIYIPETTPVGILQISHGMCEYMGRYDRFMADLAGKGWIVAGNDHLGHGESSDESQYGFFGERLTIKSQPLKCVETVFARWSKKSIAKQRLLRASVRLVD